MSETPSPKIRIKVNEKEISLPAETTLQWLKDQFKPNADLIIYNGFPISSEHPLQSGDEIILIKKGERPSPEEMECLMMSRHTPGVYHKVKSSVVGIAGLGGLGSSIAIALARVGVGTLILADFDRVEPSNLNRQQYFIHQIGMPKVEALQENLSGINPCVKIQLHDEKITRENVERILKTPGSSWRPLIGPTRRPCSSMPSQKRMPEKYIVAASGVAGYGDSNEIHTIRFSSTLFVVGDQKTAAQPGVGLMAPRVGIAAHHQANIVLRILLGEEE